MTIPLLQWMVSIKCWLYLLIVWDIFELCNGISIEVTQDSYFVPYNLPTTPKSQNTSASKSYPKFTNLMPPGAYDWPGMIRKVNNYEGKPDEISNFVTEPEYSDFLGYFNSSQLEQKNKEFTMVGPSYEDQGSISQESPSKDIEYYDQMNNSSNSNENFVNSMLKFISKIERDKRDHLNLTLSDESIKNSPKLHQMIDGAANLLNYLLGSLTTQIPSPDDEIVEENIDNGYSASDLLEKNYKSNKMYTDLKNLGPKPSGMHIQYAKFGPKESITEEEKHDKNAMDDKNVDNSHKSAKSRFNKLKPTADESEYSNEMGSTNDGTASSENNKEEIEKIVERKFCQILENLKKCINCDSMINECKAHHSTQRKIGYQKQKIMKEGGQDNGDEQTFNLTNLKLQEPECRLKMLPFVQNKVNDFWKHFNDERFIKDRIIEHYKDADSENRKSMRMSKKLSILPETNFLDMRPFNQDLFYHCKRKMKNPEICEIFHGSKSDSQDSSGNKFENDQIFNRSEYIPLLVPTRELKKFLKYDFEVKNRKSATTLAPILLSSKKYFYFRRWTQSNLQKENNNTSKKENGENEKEFNNESNEIDKGNYLEQLPRYLDRDGQNEIGESVQQLTKPIQVQKSNPKYLEYQDLRDEQNLDQEEEANNIDDENSRDCINFFKRHKKIGHREPSRNFILRMKKFLHHGPQRRNWVAGL